MKKIGNFVVNSTVLFLSYFVSSTLCMIVVQPIMRLFVDANSKGEYLWKTVYLYAWILATCIVHLKITASTHKTKYLAAMKDKEWSLKGEFRYILKNSDFWINSVGFAIWPIIIPNFFGVIHLFYFRPNFVECFPKAILSIMTVSFPILIFSAIGWGLVLRQWFKNRLHTN